MKVKEAAIYLGVCASTIRNWTNQGRPLSYLKDPITGYRYFKIEDLDAFMKNWKKDQI